MKTHKVLFYRYYIVHIDANNKYEAKSLTEFLLPEKKMPLLKTKESNMVLELVQSK